METKYTKGEWKIETAHSKLPKDCTTYYIFTSHDMAICEFTRANHIKEETEANAKLIAAAPELLEALLMANSALKAAYGDGFCEWIESVEIEKVINKATK